MKAFSGTRFGMFAAAHIVWSVVCSFFVMKLLDSELSAACFATAGMMLVYLLLGFLVARGCHWPRPTGKQSLWAVFLPAGIAWLWAGTTAVCLYLEGDYIALAAALGMPSFLLASPSLLFVITFVAVMGRLFRLVAPLGGDLGVTGAAIFLAGLLPSLLFWLGSRLGAIKENTEKKEPETA